MRKMRKYLSFSNVLSLAAVFIVLGGSAYAVTRNSVGTQHLKNNAVTTKKIKRNAVTAAKIRNGAVTRAKVRRAAINAPRLAPGAVVTNRIADGAVTGAKVDLASLGTVPSAAQADSAVEAQNLAGQVNVIAKLDGGETATLLSHGDVSITATCRVNDGGLDRLIMRGQTSANGSILVADDYLNGGANPNDFLNVDTPPDDRVWESISQTTSLPFVDQQIDSGFVLDPDGRMIAANSEGIAMGLNYLGTDCFVMGVFNTLG